jgi:hypothetical protein
MGYKQRSRRISKGPGFVTEYKTTSNCTNQKKSTYSNFVIGDVPFPDGESFGAGDICKVKEGTSNRNFF